MDDYIRELAPETLTVEYFQERVKAGWTPVAVEWRKPAAGLKIAAEAITTDPPYGFRIAPDGQRLETSPQELDVLFVMLEEIVRDRRFTQIADELNKRMLHTRLGAKWTPAAVFDLLPALIDMGPALTKSEEWAHRRPQTRTA